MTEGIPPTTAPSTQPAAAVSPRAAWIVAAAAAVAACICAALLCFQAPWVNGPPNFPWPYRKPTIGFVLWFIASAAPVATWLIVPPKGRSARFWALATFCVCALAMRVVIAVHLPTETGWSEVDRIVRDEFATSYYHDGKRLIDFAATLRSRGEPVKHWISVYDIFLPAARVHTRVKPPGPVVYWMCWLAAVGDARAPVAGAVALMLLASLAPLAVYRLSRRLGFDVPASVVSAGLMALSPGFLLSTPAFDPVYPTYTCALMLAWLTAVERGSAAWAAVTGFIVAVATLMSLHLLTVGIAVAAVPFLAGRVAIGVIIRRTLWLSPLAIVTILAIYTAVVLIFDYAAVAVIHLCFEHQGEARFLDPARFTWAASLFDLSDAAMGIGWAAAVAFVAALCIRSALPAARRLAAVAATTVLIIAVFHLLPAETARVWNLFFPLLLAPAGWMLSVLPRQPRALVMACHAISVAATCAMLKFLVA